MNKKRGENIYKKLQCYVLLPLPSNDTCEEPNVKALTFRMQLTVSPF